MQIKVRHTPCFTTNLFYNHLTEMEQIETYIKKKNNKSFLKLKNSHK